MPQAIVRRRLADDVAERPAEGAQAGKADVEADVGDAAVGLAQQEHRALNPPPLHDEATAAQLRELIAKGAMSGLVFLVDDVRALYETLKARGVTDFTQEPTDHFYGTDMGIRDPFGNAIRILQQGKVAQKVTA